MNSFKYTTNTGAAKKSESKRSSTPPCPGRILPLSLMPKYRLNMDSVKSPKVDETTVKTLMAIQWISLISGIKLDMKYEAVIAISVPPMAPSHDFLGEIRSNRRCLPNDTPTRYAPES